MASADSRRKVRILLADDHGVLRAGLRALLNGEPAFAVVGEAGDGDQALKLSRELCPDVLLMDISMPGMDGIQVTREVKKVLAHVHVVILSVHEDEKMLQEAFRAGASGYVVKRAVESELINAINAVMRGEMYVHPAVTRALLSVPQNDGLSVEDPSLQLLSPREIQVLRLVAEGFTNVQIADELVLSVRTVESHRANIMNKLSMHTRAELVQYARGHGLLES